MILSAASAVPTAKHMNRIPWDKLLSFSYADLVKLFLSAAIIVLVNKVQLFNDRLTAAATTTANSAAACRIEADEI